MTLRTRLVVSLTGLLLLVVAAVGVAASRSVHGILVDQIDGSLVAVAARRGFPTGTGEQPADTVLFRSIAEIHMTRAGRVILARPSGFTDDPDELPDIAGLPRREGFAYVPSADRSIRYRTFVDARPSGAVSIYATPMTAVTEAVRTLIRKLALAGGAVLLLGGAATWWTVKRATEPVDEMIEVAASIAAGDLGRRIPELDPGSELGKLATALNKMLSDIERAVTSEREARERLRQFVADASHELRTPLTTIIGYAELRRRGGLADPAVEEQAWARIESESRRMASLTEDLLTLARLGQTQPLQFGEVDLVGIVRDMVDDHRAVDPGRPVELEAPDSLLITADAERVQQVVGNLLSNLRVHTPSGTTAIVRLTGGPDEVSLEVSDTGPGIPEDSLEAVFERFYRTDRSRARKMGGSGLGLAIVRAIVEAHGGSVSAHNRPEGGAVFRVTLPGRPENA